MYNLISLLQNRRGEAISSTLCRHLLLIATYNISSIPEWQLQELGTAFKSTTHY